jgi:hypothetical protein
MLAAESWVAVMKEDEQTAIIRTASRSIGGGGGGGGGGAGVFESAGGGGGEHSRLLLLPSLVQGLVTCNERLRGCFASLVSSLLSGVDGYDTKSRGLGLQTGRCRGRVTSDYPLCCVIPFYSLRGR